MRSVTKIGNVICGELEVGYKFEYFVQAGEDGVGSPEWIFPKEEFKVGLSAVLIGLPVGVGHGDLVEIREEGGDQVVGRFWEGFG